MARLNIGFERIKHLAGIQNAGGVERFAEFAHDAHLGIASKLRQKRFFRDADTVFAGDGAAHGDRQFHHPGEGHPGTLAHVRILGIEYHHRVGVPVAGMRERDVRNGAKELIGGSPFAMLPYLSQFFARPRWLAAWLLDDLDLPSSRSVGR